MLVTLSRWTCLYWVGTSSLPTYSVLLIYFGFGGLLDVGVALATIIGSMGSASEVPPRKTPIKTMYYWIKTQLNLS